MKQGYFHVVWRNIQSRKLRSWLTVIGIVIGITAITSLYFLGQGLENAIIAQFQNFGSRQIMVVPKGLMGLPIEARGLTLDDEDALQSIKEFDYIRGVLFQFGKISFKRIETYSTVLGIPEDIMERRMRDLNIEIVDGKSLEETGKFSAVIGNKVATDLFDNKEIKVGNSIFIEDVKFKVVGILEKTGSRFQDRQIIIPFRTAREIFKTNDDVNVIVGAVRNIEDVPVIKEKIEHILEKKRGDNDFMVITPDEILRQINTILGIVRYIVIGISVIALLVGAIGIMNSMFTSVLQRTREIGIMKAIGAKNSDIMLIFLIESGFIGLTGGVIGIFIGSVLALIVQYVATYFDVGLLKVHIDPIIVLVVLSIALGLGVLFGILPAYRAAKLRPVDALRYE
ncbi:hypothetical protein DRJ17_01720 [Candidatus Woesearchaeota archaeon]|nr:MAG: hypothetical protein DRJ17_01720 [Candidatus Woesearchaeota archaeon]